MPEQLVWFPGLPDSSGNFYALGVYHTGPANCAINPVSNIPEDFVSVVSDSARDNIRQLIKANIGEVVPQGDSACRPEEGRLRCPLGACLPPSKVNATILRVLATQPRRYR